MNNERMVMRPEVRTILGVSNETLRRWIRDQQFPAPDVSFTRLRHGWKASTLRRRGLVVPEPSPQTPASSRA